MTRCIPWKEAAEVLLHVMRGLAYAHQRGVVHRDIKPSNVLFRESGEPVLSDFGIAKTYDPEVKTTIGARAVTPGYSPVEQYGHGKTDTRADLNARAHLASSVAHWVRTWIGRHEADEYPRVATRVADIMLRGMAGDGACWPPPVLAIDAPASEDAGAGHEAFLRAATALVNEQGYRGASVDRISARLNVTKGSFYHHHDKKLDLIAACFDRSFGVLRRCARVGRGRAGQRLPRLSQPDRRGFRLRLSKKRRSSSKMDLKTSPKFLRVRF